MPLWAGAQFLPERKYEEVLDPPTPVSGHAVVGAVVLTSPKDQQSDTLWVRRGGGLSRIRVDVASANGRLQGEGIWSFKPEPKAEESAGFQLVVSEPDRFAAQSGQQLNLDELVRATLDVSHAVTNHPSVRSAIEFGESENARQRRPRFQHCRACRELTGEDAAQLADPTPGFELASEVAG